MAWRKNEVRDAINKDMSIPPTLRATYQASVGQFLVLVVNPSSIGVVDPVGSSKDVTRHISRTSLDLFRQPFHCSASQDELKPADKWQLSGRLKRIAGKLAVERRVDTSSSNEPSEAGSHGN